LKATNQWFTETGNSGEDDSKKTGLQLTFGNAKPILTSGAPRVI
jgi:hypothetical protein